jgi:hypothetical protein
LEVDIISILREKVATRERMYNRVRSIGYVASSQDIDAAYMDLLDAQEALARELRQTVPADDSCKPSATITSVSLKHLPDYSKAF